MRRRTEAAAPVASRPRIVELSSPGLAVVRGLADAGIGAAIGVGYGFLLILVLGIVGEETLWSVYRDLEPLLQGALGTLLVFAVVLAVVVPVLLLIERFTVLRLGERHVAEHPDEVPSQSFRTALDVAPGEGLAVAGTIVMVVFGLLGAISLGMFLFGDEFREEPVVWIAAAGSAVLFAVGWMLRRSARGVADRSGARVAALRRQWAPVLSAAVNRDAAQRRSAPYGVLPRIVVVPSARALGRGVRIVGIVAGVASLIFIVSVVLRQPCRGCDQLSWDQPMEDAIDVLSLSGGGLLVLCGVVGGLLWLSGLALQAVREAALRRWAADGAPRQADAGVLPDFLIGQRAARRAARALAAVGTVALAAASGIDQQGSSDVAALPIAVSGAAALAVAVALGIREESRARADRQALRDATFPGDVGDGARAERRRRRSGRG